MIYWAPLLHFYQPPTQFHAILEKVCNESYRPLLKMFSEQPKARVTINMCGVLTEMLNEHGGKDIIQNIRSLAEAGNLEFVESAKYHAILPLIPEEKSKKQIALNRQTNAYFFKDAYKPRGFFPPEMCCSEDVARLLASLGYEWMIVSGVACPAAWPLDVIYKVKADKGTIAVFYRDDVLSNKISFQGIDSQGFISALISLCGSKKDIYVITAMDAETFGHHIQSWEELFLREVYKLLEKKTAVDETFTQKIDLAREHRKIFSAEAFNSIEVVTVGELLRLFPLKTTAHPLPSSWSTTKEDIQKGNYYPLWQDSANAIHKLQWEHVDLCFRLVDRAAALKQRSKQGQRFTDIACSLLDSAIHSCQFWWANYGRMWDVNMVNKGLMLQEEVLFNAYKAIINSECAEKLKQDSYYNWVAARHIAGKIRDKLFELT